MCLGLAPGSLEVLERVTTARQPRGATLEVSVGAAGATRADMEETAASVEVRV